MFSRRKQEVYLPEWLWFFLLLPLGLFVLLLYRQKRLPQLRDQIRSRLASLPQPFSRAPRYTEPDSIPLEIRPEAATYTGIEVEAEGETGTDTEDVALAKVSAMQETGPAPEETAATEQAGPTTHDDLVTIEGIGPVISGILRDSGIVTFRQLADTSVERLAEILRNAGLRRLADPGTWPEQARLAADGDWDTLRQLQDTLKAGRRAK